MSGLPYFLVLSYIININVLSLSLQIIYYASPVLIKTPMRGCSVHVYDLKKKYWRSNGGNNY